MLPSVHNCQRAACDTVCAVTFQKEEQFYGIFFMRSFNFLPYVNGIAAVLTHLVFLLTFIRNEIYLHRWNRCGANLAVPMNQYSKPSPTYLHFYPFCTIIFSAIQLIPLVYCVFMEL